MSPARSTACLASTRDLGLAHALNQVIAMPSHHKLLDNLRNTVSQGSLAITGLSHCHGLKLHLLSENYPRGKLADDEMKAILANPAYWAFCWASGHALATFIFRHPQLFRGRRVVDFGAGSGVVAIAVAMVGAAQVTACDSDPMAIDAIAANARLNNVQVLTCPNLDLLDEAPDLIVAADVLYDRDNHLLLKDFQSRTEAVLLADSRLKQLPVPGYRVIHQCNFKTLPDLDEAEEFNRVKIYHHTSRFEDK